MLHLQLVLLKKFYSAVSYICFASSEHHRNKPQEVYGKARFKMIVLSRLGICAAFGVVDTGRSTTLCSFLLELGDQLRGAFSRHICNRLGLLVFFCDLQTRF